jgi:hypothetical protein
MGTPLQKLEDICAEIYGRWDKDQRSGKLLLALAGDFSGYRKDVTDVREALAAAQTLLDRADSVIRTDAAGNRFRMVFADDLDRLRAASNS